MSLPASIRIFAVAALSLIITACGSPKKKQHRDSLHVAAGIGPVAAMAERIGGDSVTVECLLPSGANPEEFDPGTKALRQLSRSEIYFSTGTLPFEHRLASGFSGNLPDMLAADLSNGLEMIYGTHGDEPDPHTWMSVRNLAVMAANMTQALCEARPSAATYFRSRLESYNRELAAADSALTSQLAPLAGEAFAVGHPSLSYMARDYSLRQIPLSEGTKENSAKGRRTRIDSIRAAHPRVLFAEPGTENDMAREMAADLGIPMMTIDAMNPDVLTQLKNAAASLAASE